MRKKGGVKGIYRQEAGGRWLLANDQIRKAHTVM